MRAVDTAAQAQREARTGIIEIPMVWIEGRDRDTGAWEGLGIWGGPDTENISVIDMFTGVGVSRQFQGAGGLLNISPVRHESGLNIRPVTISLSSIDATVRQAIRGYDPRGGRVQVWRRSYMPITWQPIAVEPWFKGFVNKAPITRSTAGSEGTVELEVVSTARILTIASQLKKSDEAQRLRSEDRFRRYKAIAGVIDVPWGTHDTDPKK